MKKIFDSVKMMREIRNKLAHKYSNAPELEDEELEQIRKKYKIKIKLNRKTALQSH